MLKVIHRYYIIKIIISGFFYIILIPGLLGASDTVMEITNGGFEDGLHFWTIPANEGISSLSSVRAASGSHSLRINDTFTSKGSSVTSTRVTIHGAGAYELRGWIYPVSGSGLGMYVHMYDANGLRMSNQDPHLRGLGGSEKQWHSFALPFYTSRDTAALELWIHSYNAALVEAFLDDLEFVRIDADTQPPWPGQYKIRPDETERLTPADVVGPDGIVYPNWTRCGVQADFSDPANRVHIQDFGAMADDGKDDAQALHDACVAVGNQGGGVVVLGEGVYDLYRTVTVRHNHVVIRGQGRDKTRLMFRYAVGDKGVSFYHPPAGSTVGRDTPLEMHCIPTGLMKMTMKVDDAVIGTWQRSEHSGNTFSFKKYGRDVIGKVGSGRHTLSGTAEYDDGSTRMHSIPIVLDDSYNETRLFADSRAVITFSGKGRWGSKIKLAADGQRGDTTLTLLDTSSMHAGDVIYMEAPATQRWKELTKNQCPWGLYRAYMTVIEEVTGDTVLLNQPLRIEFPIIDGSFIQKVVPITGCGLEDMYIEQTENLWISTAIFSYAMNCWGRGITVKNCGRFPLYGSKAKWCEIRDCIFDDAWFKGGGGTAYAGWEQSWDCLAEDIVTYKLRHAPLFQWGASGCVIRKGIFHESDAQWHSGWTHENLIELCVVTSVPGHGSYGYGMWASPPEDTAHGPNGPRNVVYNCDISSVKAGLWMGGMNENWLILHNRFVVEQQQGIFAKTASFDHIIKNNVFVLKDENAPTIFLASPDCIDIEAYGNTCYGGNGTIVDGPGQLSVEQDNSMQPYTTHHHRPIPEVTSIYEWQNRPGE